MSRPTTVVHGTSATADHPPGRRRLEIHGMPTLVVAASNSTDNDKDLADYIATGESDNDTIQRAIDALPHFGSDELYGRVWLCEGTYNVTNSIIVPSPYVDLQGTGDGTILLVTYPAASNYTVVVFSIPGGA